MKKIASGLALAGLCAAGPAHADTSVTLYGIADTSLRYVNHANAEGNSKFGMAPGHITGSRWGLRGTEELGSGMKAFFRLENGFNLQNGTSSAMFGRKSYVGLDAGQAGAISLGRQDTPLFTILGDTFFDPFSIGNYDQNSWLPVAATFGGRQNNSIVYRNDKLAPGLDVILQYTFADTSAQDMRLGKGYAGAVTYTNGPFSVGGGYQLFRSTDKALLDKEHRTWNLNAAYQIGAAKLFVGYMNIKDGIGGFSQGNAPMYMSGTPGLDRKDNGFFLGATYGVGSWSYTGAFYYDRAKNVEVDGDKGRRYAIALAAEYAFSKRTQVYGTVDYNHASDVEKRALNGFSSQIGGGVGIRHIF